MSPNVSAHSICLFLVWGVTNPDLHSKVFCSYRRTHSVITRGNETASCALFSFIATNHEDDNNCSEADWFLPFKENVKYCPAVWNVCFLTYRIASCQKQRGNVLRRKQGCWKDYNIPTLYVFMTPGRDPPKAGNVLYWSLNSWRLVLSKREYWWCWYTWLDHLKWY